MEGSNPFSLSFGKKPVEYISRISQNNRIIDEFESQEPPNQVYMITGVRGYGKTVMMAGIANHFAQDKDWIVVELTPERDLLESLAAHLYESSLQLDFIEAKLDLSILGIGVSIKGAGKTTSVEVAAEKMLRVLKKKGKRLLVTIDEVINNQYVREFSSLFQIYLRQEYPIFLIMTGLYENIYNLQNEKTLTFLYRAPKIHLMPLNSGAIINRYQKIFDISREEAREMALLTKGYPFAFQVLGYLRWNHEDDESILSNLIPVYDQYLDEYVYSKIWSELSPVDKTILKAITDDKITRVAEIREHCGMPSEKFSVYRKRLINKGIIRPEGHGYVEIALPRFAEFVMDQW